MKNWCSIIHQRSWDSISKTKGFAQFVAIEFIWENFVEPRRKKKQSFWLNEPLQLSLVPQKKHLNATKIGSLGLNSEKLHTWIGLLFLFSRFSSNSNFMYGNLCAIQIEACTQTKDATTVQRWIERMTEICMLPKMFIQNKQILLYQSENETEWNFL